MDENNIIKKKKNNNYYRHHHNQNRYYYKKNNKKKNLIMDNNDTREIKNILLYNETNDVPKPIDINSLEKKEVLPQVEIPVIKAYELINTNNNIDIDDIVPKTSKKKKINFNISPKIAKYGMSFAILLIVILGTSYSYFNYTKIDPRQADIATGDVYVKIVENIQNISLNKMYPREDLEARSRNDNYFDFTVVAKNTSDTRVVEYEIDIINGQDVENKVRINPKYIKIDLQEKVNNEYVYIKEGVTLDNYSYTGIVPVNTNGEIAREYRLRLWVSDEVIISDSINTASYTQSEFANLYANYTVTINSRDTVIGSINACDGCKYTYRTQDILTTWNMAGYTATYDPQQETPTVITTGLYDSYLDLINETGKSYFIGVKLNSNNEVTDAYLCGIRNNIPFCLETASDGSKYQSNKETVQRIWNNTCNIEIKNQGTSSQYENMSCGKEGSVKVSGNSHGPLNVGIDANNSCFSYTNGTIGCRESS